MIVAQNYHLVSRLIHWVTALLIFGLLSVGYYMASLDIGEDKLAFYALHKSFGLLVLMLAFVRVVWHIVHKKPKSLSTHQRWEKALAHAAHAFLYFVLFALPLSGWVMSSAGEFPVTFFGIPVPRLMGKDENIFEFMRESHEIMALILFVVLGLHVAGAFKHHFIDKDATLSRMIGRETGFGMGVVLVVIAGALFAPPAYFIARDIFAGHDGQHVEIEEQNVVSNSDITETPSVLRNVAQWDIQGEDSAIRFTATQGSESFSGTFGGFDGEIYFDPENLPESYARVIVQIAPVQTGSGDRDAMALSADWFDAQNFPQAVFETQSFSKSESDGYIAHANLTIRGQSVPVALPFTLSFTQEGDVRYAQMDGVLTLERLAFGVGQGQWESTQTIANEVKIDVSVKAKMR